MFILLSIFSAPLVLINSTLAASVPESFSELAEKAGPAVVNIRTEKINKEGGRVLPGIFYKGPFDKEDPMKDFFDRFFEQDPPSGI